MIGDLSAALERVARDAACRVLVLTGSGRALDIAAAIAVNSPAAVRSTKSVMWRSGGQPDLARVSDVEIQAQRACIRPADRREVLAAFTQRRPAVFTGE